VVIGYRSPSKLTHMGLRPEWLRQDTHLLVSVPASVKWGQELLWGPNKLLHVKHWELSVAHGKCSVRHN
jgi:hypothetical protein